MLFAAARVLRHGSLDCRACETVAYAARWLW